MQKKILTVFLSAVLCLLFTACSGQSTEPAADDAESTQTDSSVTTVTAGADDLVAAVYNDNYDIGYINTAGEWVIAPQYSSASPFVNGLALVGTSGYPAIWQIIDKTGTVQATLPEGVTPVSSWNDNALITYSFNGNNFINEGMIIITSADGKYGVADTSGTIIVEPQYTNIRAYSEGLAAVNFGTDTDERWGYLDQQGNTAVPGTFRYATEFADGLAFVWLYEDGDSADSLGSEGFIDTTGNVVIHGHSALIDGLPAWQGYSSRVSNFRDGVAFCEYYVGNDLKFGLIDHDMTVIWTAEDGLYSNNNFYLISEDVLAVSVKLDSGEWGIALLDTTGNQLTPVFDDLRIKAPLSDGLVRFSSIATGKYGYLDQNGTIVLPSAYDDAYSFYNGYASVLIDGEYQYIDTSGTISVTGAFQSYGMPFTK